MQLTCSTMPLLDGGYCVVKMCAIATYLLSRSYVLQRHSVPLSIISSVGILIKWGNIFEILELWWNSLLWIEIAVTYLLKWSTAIKHPMNPWLACDEIRSAKSSKVQLEWIFIKLENYCCGGNFSWHWDKWCRSHLLFNISRNAKLNLK